MIHFGPAVEELAAQNMAMQGPVHDCNSILVDLVRMHPVCPSSIVVSARHVAPKHFVGALLSGVTNREIET